MFQLFRHYFHVKFVRHIRYLHYTVMVIALTQLLLSNGMHIDKQGQIRETVLAQVSTWGHIVFGCLFLLSIVLFTWVELRAHGLRYFYPYLWWQCDQIKADFQQLKQRRLPEANPQGVAACVQGLGLGAGLLVAISGSMWLMLWLSDSGWSHDAKDVHKTLTGLIEAYIVGHGLLGLLHIYLSRSTVQ
ncbi:cytochrome b/b6 domain-containing protein [Photobacterium japonica]|uniref:cytochrome b/b6 domain-containing protein n=1 Tax=Photobacterium japonica TaxID=2910235 RepID=UPI003D0B2389